MKTVESIISIAKILEPGYTTANVNGFVLQNTPVKGSYSNHYEFTIRFDIELNEYHIQPLLDMGVQLLFDDKRKASGGNDNTLIMPAVCSLAILERLNDFARHNHLKQLSLCNRVQLRNIFPFSGRKVEIAEKKSEFQLKIKSIRKKARRIKSEKCMSPTGYGFIK